MNYDLWIEYLLRFSHLVAGIAWIGSSFYFIWLDRSFVAPASPRRNVDGELFMLHGGFYYQVEKRKIYPGEIPPTLHWFKWEATLTWISGFFLFGFLYYLRGASLLIDPQNYPFSQAGAIFASLGVIAVSWAVYDHVLWNARLIQSKTVSVGLSAIFLSSLIFGLTRLFSGRGAFIIAGIVMGTMMVLNVWIRILPGQTRMLKDAQAGKIPDYTESLRSKVRSVHNTYFIFPVLFIMLSNHYPVLYNHPQNWLLLIVLGVSGAIVRHVMVTKNPSERWLLLPAAAGIAALMLITTSEPPKPSSGKVEYAQLHAILQSRCLQCHSSANTDDIYKTAPNGIKFESEEQLRSRADKIHLHVILAKSMPLANKTGMTDAERSVFDQWLRQENLVRTP
jgi:uncharacterized membrane protein